MYVHVYLHVVVNSDIQYVLCSGKITLCATYMYCRPSPLYVCACVEESREGLG